MGLNLRNNCQRQIIPIAANIAGLKVVAVDGDDRAIGEVAEGAADRVCAGVADHSQDSAERQPALRLSLQPDCGPVNCHSVGYDQVGTGLARSRLESVGIGRVRRKIQAALQCQSDLLVAPKGRCEKRARPPRQS